MKPHLLTTLCCFGALALASAQTISNPSFEANSFTKWPGYISTNGPIVGWTTTDPWLAGLNPASGSPFADNGEIPDGYNVAFIQSGTNSSLSTVISNLTVGQAYKVSFRVNARSGNIPNLKVDIAGTNNINTTVAAVGSSNPYQYFAFDFTAAAPTQTLTLRNDATNDATVLVDNFSIALRNSGWSYAAWNDDASSGVSGNRSYTHAFNFGASASPVINGLIFTGIAGANPAVSNSFSTTGLPNVFSNDLNNVTGGSSQLARDFVYGGAVETLTIQRLTIGKAYVATIYSVGFDTNGARAATFSVGNDRLTVNQDQFGYHNGIRVSYHFTANATSNTFTYVPLNPGATFHTYGFSVYQVPEVVVTNAADSGPGSLRQLVSQADTFALITFTNTLSGQTIVLTGGQLTISNNVTIDASSLPGGITLSGNHSNRIFKVSPGATLSLNALTLTNGYAGSGGNGGAILVDTGGTVTLNNSTLSGNSATGIGGAVGNFAGLVVITNSTLSGNTAAGAGAIENDNGTLIISASTVSGNVTTGNGGAIDNDAGALLRLDNSTLAGNSAVFSGGGIENYQATAIINNSTISTNSAGSAGGGAGGLNNFGTLALTNAIVSGNTAPSQPDLNLDSSGSFAGSNNLTNGNPLLAPLGNYGGPTQTMPPLAGSPAIDAGNDSVTSFLATDQRGFPRHIGARVDIGAVEYMGSPLVTTTADAGGGSLRDAVAFSTNGATITFTNTLSGQTIVLTNGQITLTNNLTIDASSVPAGVTLSGNHACRIFEVSSGITAILASLTLINGYAGSSGSGPLGGAVLVDPDGTLTLNNSRLSGNSAGGGGGIYNHGTPTLNNSTLSGNSAGEGGGFLNQGTFMLNNSTLSGNSAGGGGGISSYVILTVNNSTLAGNSANEGGGIWNSGATITLINSTLSGNSATNIGGGIYISPVGSSSRITNTIVAGNSAATGANISGNPSFVSSVSSLTNGNPLLAPLGNYGGPTQTMPPLHGSPAIDAGTDSVTNFLATDQRGYPRASGLHVDIGAVEAQVVNPANAPVLTKPVMQTNGAVLVGFASSPNADFTVLASTNVALPLAQWSLLGAAMQHQPGQFQFTDPNATNYPQRFYRVTSP